MRRRGGEPLAAAAEAAARLSSQVANVVVTAGGLSLATAECGRPPRVTRLMASVWSTLMAPEMRSSGHSLPD